MTVEVARRDTRYRHPSLSGIALPSRTFAAVRSVSRESLFNTIPGKLTMKRSASALIRPLFLHDCQIVGSVKPILRLPQSSLIRKIVLGVLVPVSLLVGSIIASMSATRSFADFAIPPAESKVFDKQKIPSIGISPTVGFNAYSAARFAGVMRDPIVSVPTASVLNPAAKLTADPVDDPPGADNSQCNFFFAMCRATYGDWH